MSNVLTVPASGAIYFDSGTAGSSTVPVLTSGVALNYDGGAGLNITSYNPSTSATDRFSVDGANGRLFSVSDSLTGTIFSVNDAAGLPIIEVNSTTTDVVNIGTYGTNALVVSGSNVGIGTATPTTKLDIKDTWNTTGTFTALKLDVTDSGPANAASLLMDLQVGGSSKLTLNKTGSLTIRNNGGSSPFFEVNGGNVSQCLVGRSPTSNIVGVYVRNGGFIGFTNDQANGTPDTLLARDGAAGTLAQRNGNGINAAQTFRLYNTYTSSTIFERLNFRWSGNTAFIGTEKGIDGGTARDLVLETDGTERMRVGAAEGVTISSYISISSTATNDASNLPAFRFDGSNQRSIRFLTSNKGGGNVFGFVMGNNYPRVTIGVNQIALGSDNGITWYSAPNGVIYGSVWTRLDQSSQGVLEINNGTAGQFRDLTLRNLTASGDIEVTDSTKGIILKSPDGTRYRVTVDNTGTLITTEVV